MSTLRWTLLRLQCISRVEISHRASRSRMSLITGEALSCTSKLEWVIHVRSKLATGAKRGYGGRCKDRAQAGRTQFVVPPGECDCKWVAGPVDAVAATSTATPTTSLQQQAHTQQQHQAQRAVMEMHCVLSGGLGASVSGGLGGGLMNTSGTNSLSGGLGPMEMGGNMSATGMAGNNGPGAGGFRNVGLGLGVPAGGASFGGLNSGTGLDGSTASGGGDGGGLGGMPPGGVTLDMYQSFMQRNGEGGQGQ